MHFLKKPDNLLTVHVENDTPFMMNTEEEDHMASRLHKNTVDTEIQLLATHRGNFKKDFGIDVDCYVLNDDIKTAVISQRGMGDALGLGAGGSRLPTFVKGKIISEALGVELIKKISKPLIFKCPSMGINAPLPRPVHGYDVTLLIDICKAIIRAETEGKLLKSQANIAKQAHIIVAASAKAGIKGLVYALSGYDVTREEIISSFKRFVAQEARGYEKEFPDELYEEWYRLYQEKRPKKNKPWRFMHLTNSQVYKPLARSNGRLLKLLKAHKREYGTKNNKLHQFLAEIGVKALRQHLGQLLAIAKLAKSRVEYECNFEKLFSDQLPLDLSLDENDGNINK